jgi:DNA-binding MarR family transcriptional regulator
VPDPDPHMTLVATCHDLTHRVSAAMSRYAGPELLALDLTMGQFKALAMVTNGAPQAVGELGRRLGISEPAASLLVDKLEELGLVARERDRGDRRRTLVSATAAAEDLVTRLREGRQEYALSWLGRLSDDELAGLRLGLSGLLRMADDMAGSGNSRRAQAEVPGG